MKNDRKDNERPEAYPKPSSTDQQLKNQTEFLDNEVNKPDEDGTPVTYNQPQTDERMREREEKDTGEKAQGQQGLEYVI